MSRFLVLLLGTVLAARSHPVSAAASAAHPASADTERVHLGSAESGGDAFVVWPPGKGPAPTVVVAHEWFGLNAQIRGIAYRLAEQGYVAIAPDLYHGKVAGDPENAHILMRGLDEDDAVTEMVAAVDWAAAQPRTAGQKIGVLGFCMGGRLSELTALRSGRIAAVVMFYGPPEARPERLASLHAPLLGHFGAEDQGIDVRRVNDFRAALQRAGKSGEIYEYSGAGHQFMNDTQPAYRPDAAKLAWARTLAFLQKNLRGAKG